MIAGLVSLISLVGFVQFWKPKYRAEFAASLTPVKSSTDDEESNSRRSSIIQNGATAEKSQTEGSSAPTEKVEDTQIEDRNNLTTNGESKKEASASLVVRPNVRETLLAWSPWVIIVVVVIM